GPQPDVPGPPRRGRLYAERRSAQRIGGARIDGDAHVGALRPQLDVLVWYGVAERVSHRYLHGERPFLRAAQLEPPRPQVRDRGPARAHDQLDRGTARLRGPR